MNTGRLFTRAHVALYKISRGRLGGQFRGAPVLLLTTAGSKSGKERTTPLLYLKDGDRLIIVASNGGRDKSPSWWTNLRHNPEAQVQIRGEKKEIVARRATAEEKERLWPELTKMYPAYNDYQQKTRRDIPVVILSPAKS